MTARAVARFALLSLLSLGVSIYAVALAQMGDCTPNTVDCEGGRTRDGWVMAAVCLAVYAVVATRALRRWKGH